MISVREVHEVKLIQRQIFLKQLNEAAERMQVIEGKVAKKCRHHLRRRGVRGAEGRLHSFRFFVAVLVDIAGNS